MNWRLLGQQTAKEQTRSGAAQQAVVDISTGASQAALEQLHTVPTSRGSKGCCRTETFRSSTGCCRTGTSKSSKGWCRTDTSRSSTACCFTNTFGGSTCCCRKTDLGAGGWRAVGAIYKFFALKKRRDFCLFRNKRFVSECRNWFRLLIIYAIETPNVHCTQMTVLTWINKKSGQALCLLQTKSLVLW